MSGALAASLLMGLAACDRVLPQPKPEADIAAGSASGSLNTPGTLATAIYLVNDGAVTAEDVQATRISISGATLTSPASLPEALGAVPKDGSTILNAVFVDPSFQPGGRYVLQVEGTFREQGRTYRFAVERSIAVPAASPGSAPAGVSSSPPHVVNGAHFPAEPPHMNKEVNEGGLSAPVPEGPPPPPAAPSPSSGVKPAPKGDPPGFDMNINQPLGFTTTGVTPNEPSGAVNGAGVVFQTANSYASYSKDGVTFTKITPSTIFPNSADGGFCCDQVVLYAASIDRFIWIMQYNQAPVAFPATAAATGNNRYRIAVASPAQVLSSGGTAWTYWDITTPQVNGAGSTDFWFDYPDASLGDNYLYLSCDIIQTVPAAGGKTSSVGAGHVIFRIPLKELQAGTTIHFGFTKPSDSGLAWGGHISQDTRDEVFWAGHVNNSSIRVFNWPESSNSYSWRDISIGAWPQISKTNLMTSQTPDKVDWLSKLSNFPGNAVTAIARSSGSRAGARVNQIYLGWTGAIGNGFKQPQVQWITLDRNNNFALVKQQQVWNASYAFAYPEFSVNPNNELGMSLEWGGGGNYENHVVGFWGDYIVYATTDSTVGTGRFGDYVTIRPYGPDSYRFAAFGYGWTSSGYDTRYVVFSRPGQ